MFALHSLFIVYVRFLATGTASHLKYSNEMLRHSHHRHNNIDRGTKKKMKHTETETMAKYEWNNNIVRTHNNNRIHKKKMNFYAEGNFSVGNSYCYNLNIASVLYHCTLLYSTMLLCMVDFFLRFSGLNMRVYTRHTHTGLKKTGFQTDFLRKIEPTFCSDVLWKSNTFSFGISDCCLIKHLVFSCISLNTF